MRIVRLPAVLAMTGLARSTTYKYIDEGRFPAPVPLGGRSVGWIEQEVLTWISEKVEERKKRRSI